jgi:hypothetical protein
MFLREVVLPAILISYFIAIAYQVLAKYITMSTLHIVGNKIGTWFEYTFIATGFYSISKNVIPISVVPVKAYQPKQKHTYTCIYRENGYVIYFQYFTFTIRPGNVHKRSKANCNIWEIIQVYIYIYIIERKIFMEYKSINKTFLRNNLRQQSAIIMGSRVKASNVIPDGLRNGYRYVFAFEFLLTAVYQSLRWGTVPFSTFKYAYIYVYAYLSLIISITYQLLIDYLLIDTGVSATA